MENNSQENNANPPIPDIITSGTPPVAPAPAEVPVDSIEKPKNTGSLITIILVASIFIGLAVIMFVCDPFHLFHNQPAESEPEKPLTSSEILDLRLGMVSLANDSVGIPGLEFKTKMEKYINEAPTQDAKKSLEHFFVYIAIRAGFAEEAAEMYDGLMQSSDSMTPHEICELREYRALAAATYITDGFSYNPTANELYRSENCDLAIVDYERVEGESDLDYGTRLYYSGFITNAVPILESFYDSTPPDLENTEQLAARKILADYYQMKNDLEKMYKYVASGMFGQQKEGE